ncbi:hypothetical protein CN168_29755 [Sinorhizobium medicae]|nr:hypothetical protein CN168_29755 [Sinorhizobium medicae]
MRLAHRCTGSCSRPNLARKGERPRREPCTDIPTVSAGGSYGSKGAVRHEPCARLIPRMFTFWLRRWCNGRNPAVGLMGRWSSLTMMVWRSQEWPAP